jgi:hypothetical protein
MNMLRRIAKKECFVANCNVEWFHMSLGEKIIALYAGVEPR